MSTENNKANPDQKPSKASSKRPLWEKILYIFFSILISGSIAFLVGIAEKKKDLQTLEDTTKKSFTNIIDSYEHSFLLFEELLRPKIEANVGYEEMWDYLYSEGNYGEKWNQIEGDDYDGIYMYYQDHFVYSWGRDGAGYEEYVPTSREWCYGAIAAKGSVYTCPPYLSYKNNYMLATISRLQSDGKTVIAYDLLLGSVQDFISSDNSFNGTVTMILSRNSIVVSSTNTSFVGGKLSSTEEELNQTLIDAEERLDKAKGTDDEAKRQEAVNRAKAFLDFYKSPWGNFAQKLLTGGGKMVYSIGSTSYGYVYTSNNSRFTFIIIAPISNMMPVISIWWIAIFFAFIIIGLIIGQIYTQHLNALVLEEKNQALALAAENADKANATKSRFLAQMSHEIRTPMNAIMGLTALAEDDLDNKDQIKDYLEKISGSSKLLLSVLNDVLDMSAIESGKMKLDNSPFSAREQISAVVGIFYRTAFQKGVDLECELVDFYEENLIGDGLRLNQIALNLLSNAVKFTPSGGKILVKMNEKVISDSKVHLTVMVKDTGCGMSEEMQARLFMPFEQESAKTAAKHGGSGLGLAISKRLVDLMGGTISVESKSGIGSTFVLDVDLGYQEENLIKEETDDFKGLKALILGKDEEKKEIISSLCSKEGINFQRIKDISETVEILSKEDKDSRYVLIVPFKEDGYKGLDAIKELKKPNLKSDYKIVMYGFDVNQIPLKDKKSFDYFLNEPIFLSNFCEAIKGVIHTKKETVKTTIKKYDFKGKKVMLAEDTPLNVLVATHILNKAGIEVVSVNDGKEALDLFIKEKEGTFDCILMDVNMPIMDGYEASEEIRASSKKDAKTIPIYALSADAFTSDIEKSLSHGMNGHLSKPISIDDLYSALEKAFNSK